MTKAELHVHLEGSIEPATLLQIDPALTLAEIESHTTYNTFEGFLRAYVWVNRRLSTPEHYALATRDLLARLAQQNVRYAEITLSAGVILWKQQDLTAIYEAIRGESLRAPFPVFWILDAVRQFGADAGMDVARFAVENRDHGVIAFGIGGDEKGGPAVWFHDVFRFSREGGLRLVCHAGETAGPESIWAALHIGAERIGHGITAVADAALLRHLRDHRIPLEISITSNVCTGVVARIEDHPVRRIFDAGVPLILNTDDPALFHTSLDNEYRIAAEVFGFTPEELEQCAANSFEYGFSKC